MSFTLPEPQLYHLQNAEYCWLFPDGVRYSIGKMTSRVPGTDMVTVIDCVIVVVIFHQDQVNCECIIGIPETGLKEVS